MLAGYEIHLFSYDHRQDCTDGPQSFFTERDPSTTTAQSSLWLRLEQEFIRGGRRMFPRFHGWCGGLVATAVVDRFHGLE